jgi:hypothetical protein
MFKSGDVGSGRDLGRGDGVVGTVSGDEGDLVTRGEGGDGDWGRGLSPGLLVSCRLVLLVRNSSQYRYQGSCYTH